MKATRTAKLTALALSVLCLTAVAPGNAAPLLRGYVSREQERAESRGALAAEKSQQTLPATVTITGSFPPGFEGSWRCLTSVTDSAMDGITAGQQMESIIEFRRTGDGRVEANWNQAGWREAQANVTAFNDREAQIDRTDYYFGENMNGSWAARSRDRFALVSPDKMISQSYVDQYIDGQYLGRYRTKSTLIRQNRDVAFNK